MKKNTKDYLKLSHEFAIKQAIEKISFEIQNNQEKIDLPKIHGFLNEIEIFSDNELIYIYEEAKKMVNADEHV